jgi:photosystem II stability/assembly factor-like uncharacterized protein
MKNIFIYVTIFCSVFVLCLNAQNFQDTTISLDAIEHTFGQWEEYFFDNYISQNKDTRGSGYKQFMREKFDYAMNKHFNINSIGQRRWDLFRESRIEYLNKSDKQIVSSWISLGPNSIDSLSGRMTCHAFDPVDPEIVWAGSSSGGIWRTTNGGQSWEPMTDELPSMIISDIEVNPNNRDVILAGTGNDKFLAISLGYGVGVLKSTDGGQTWYQTGFNYPLDQFVSVLKILWKPGSADSVYLAASNGIWLSTDAGDNWSLLRTGRCCSMVIDVQSPNNLYAVIRASGVYKSTDAGVTWSIMTNGLPQGSNIGFSAIAISESDPNILYASISDENTFESLGLFKSTDTGNSWNEITNAPNALCLPNAPTQCFGWFVNVISISPFDPELIFYGGLTLWRSSNGGTSWSQLDVYSSPTPNYPGRTYVDQWDVGFHPTNPDIVFVFNDGGGQKSTNKGVWWDKINNGLITAQVHKIASSATNTTLIIGGFQDRGLQKLNNTNGNVLWTRWSTNDGTNVIIDPNNNNIFYGDFFLGDHRKSSNGGATWNSNFAINNGITESGVLIPPLVMDPDNSATLYTSSTSKIYKTTNGGIPWFPVTNIPNVYTLSIDPNNSDLVYAHSYTSTTWSVWKSTDAGTNWTQINNTTIPTWRVTDLECDPTTSGTIYATRNSASLQQDHIKKSTDFGETWTDITNNLPDIFVYAITISPFDNNHLYLATELGVYASTNGGSNWVSFNDGLPIVRTYDIHYHPVDRTIRIATIGRGVWKAKSIDYLTSVDETFSNVPGDFKLYQNYPNPFNSTTVIKYDVLKQSRIKIVVYDETGQLLETLFDREKPSGTYTIQLNLNSEHKNNASGIYFLRFIANNYFQTIKLLYLK